MICILVFVKKGAERRRHILATQGVSSSSGLGSARRTIAAAFSNGCFF